MSYSFRGGGDDATDGEGTEAEGPRRAPGSPAATLGTPIPADLLGGLAGSPRPSSFSPLQHRVRGAGAGAEASSLSPLQQRARDGGGGRDGARDTPGRGTPGRRRAAAGELVPASGAKRLKLGRLDSDDGGSDTNRGIARRTRANLNLEVGPTTSFPATSSNEF